MDTKTFFIRIIICFILSILIGFERQYRHRMVGLRTNVLVCIGAFLFVWFTYGITTGDQTRIAAQVVSGIGFLGAGVILRDGSQIKGLNTAATLWCVAAIGVLCAFGMIIEATTGTVLVLASNIILRFISLSIMKKVKSKNKERYTIRISCKKKHEASVRNITGTSITKAGLVLRSLERNEITEEEVKLVAIVITDVTNHIEEAINNISKEPGITSINWEHESAYKTDSQDAGDD